MLVGVEKTKSQEEEEVESTFWLSWSYWSWRQRWDCHFIWIFFRTATHCNLTTLLSSFHLIWHNTFVFRSCLSVASPPTYNHSIIWLFDDALAIAISFHSQYHLICSSSVECFNSWNFPSITCFFFFFFLNKLGRMVLCDLGPTWNCLGWFDRSAPSIITDNCIKIFMDHYI